MSSQPSNDSVVPSSLLAAITRRGMQRTFPAHAILITEGDASESLYIILSGRLKVFASSDDGWWCGVHRSNSAAERLNS